MHYVWKHKDRIKNDNAMTEWSDSEMAKAWILMNGLVPGKTFSFYVRDGYKGNNCTGYKRNYKKIEKNFYHLE